MKNHHINPDSREFFEGWYLKHQKGDYTIAFIPGVNITENGKRQAFIQIITNNHSYVVNYPYDDVYISKSQFYVRIGNNIFSKKGIYIDIEDEIIHCRAKISYGEFTPIRYDIMGPFALVPHMQCNHGVLSLHHTINGFIEINNLIYELNGGTGYIEKDWGSSFPSTYTWLQANDFVQKKYNKKPCIMVSIAEIPFQSYVFEGLIAIVYYNKKEYRFATYNGGKVLYREPDGFMIKKNGYTLRVTLEEGQGAPLQAPATGDMNRIIHERASCKAEFEFSHNDNVLFKVTSLNASYENSNKPLAKF